MSDPGIAIVGGGVSGLATAYYLGQLGLRSLLIEKSPRLGGLIKTDLVEGCRLEAGPDSYIATKPAVTELASGLGKLGEEIVGSNDAARRIFIARGGELVPLPQGMAMMVPGRWLPALRSELFSFETKRRFLTETFTPPRQRAGDFSVGELVSDHFGGEILEYVTEPLLSGVYGGNAAELSAPSVLPRFVGYERRFGSLIRGVRQEKSEVPKSGLFLSFREGMQSLTDALKDAITGSTQLVCEEAYSLAHNQNRWEVRAGNHLFEVDHLVLACPTPVCSRLLGSVAPELAGELKQIPYSSAILITLIYETSQFRHPLDGFGFLVPPAERRTIAAATWINTKFPGRVAAGLVAIRTFIVGAEADRLLNAPESDLIASANVELQQFMGIDAAPKFWTVYRWPKSMPQYVVGHQARQQRIGEMLNSWPSLQLVGNAYDGVGIPDCVRLARTAAERIEASLLRN